jgi:hypothetical protein
MTRGHLTSAATSAVLSWCRAYTRGIPQALETDRMDEVKSDLHDNVRFLSARGTPDGSIALTLISRATRGALSDLSWRADVLRGIGQRRTVWQSQGTLLAAQVMSAAVVTLGAFGLARWTLRSAAGLSIIASPLAMLLLAAVAVCATGSILVIRRRTRILGAVAVVIATLPVFHLSAQLLSGSSATVRFANIMVPDFLGLVDLLALGVIFVYVAVAAVWLPVKRRMTEVRE